MHQSHPSVAPGLGTRQRSNTSGRDASDGDLDLIAGNFDQTNRLYRTVNFLSPGRAVSTKVNTDGFVSSVTLTSTAAVNTATTRHTRIDYFVSNNGGAKWYRAYLGKPFTFKGVRGGRF